LPSPSGPARPLARRKSHQAHGDVMNSLTGLRFALLLSVWAATWPTAAAAQTPPGVERLHVFSGLGVAAGLAQLFL